MKIAQLLSAIAGICLLTGCKIVPVDVSAVGPNPYARSDESKNGRLQVFSGMEQHVEGDNPAWFQHSDYRIVTPEYKSVRRVWNKTGYYSDTPKIVSLKPGSYLIEATAKDFLIVNVPVVIEAGKLTAVYLDGNWNPPSDANQSKISYSPGGYPVGWNCPQAAQIKN